MAGQFSGDTQGDAGKGGISSPAGLPAKNNVYFITNTKEKHTKKTQSAIIIIYLFC